MSFKIKCGCLFVISLFTVVYGVDTKTTTGDFGEVMVNISKVNGLLQELIQNYKQLKKMANTDLESEYDEKKIGVEEENIHRENRNRAEKNVKKSGTTKNRGLATAMFMSDDEARQDTEESEGQGFKEKKPRKTKNKQRNTLKVTYQFYDDSANTKSKSYSDYPYITPEATFSDYSNSSTFDIERTAVPMEDLHELMVSFVDDVITPRSKAAMYTESMPKYMLTTTTMYPKILGNIVDMRHSTPSKKHLEPRLDYDGPWSEMRKHINHRKSRKKTEIIQLRAKKSKREAGPRRTTKKAKTRDSKSVWEGDKTMKEEKKIGALRQAYGVACLTLVVRKCKRACKDVYRDSCYGDRLCTKSFMATFKKVAIRGCDKEFGRNGSTTFRVASMEQEKGIEKDGFVDLTRDGYLAMACLPEESTKSISKEKTEHKKTKTKPLRRHKKIIAVAKSESEDKPDALLILRDRFERACSRESAMKCFKACKTAVSVAIAEESGKGRKRDFMVKKCKKHCSKAYNARGYSSSTSDSDDSSESESRSRRKRKPNW